MATAGDLFGGQVKDRPVRAKRGKIPVWAKSYGYGERQIKNWIAAGKESKDPPPFDVPERMGEWFSRHYTQKVPGRLIEAIEKLTGKAPVTEKSEEKAPEPFLVPTVGEHEWGDLETQLNGYRREWALLAKLREKALIDGELSKASAYLTQQRDVSQEMRQLEKLLPTVLRDRGDTHSTAEVRAITVEMLKVLKQALLNRGLKAATRLRAADSDQGMMGVWKDEIHAVFGDVCASRFEEILQLDAA